ncbi:hypothetical protein FHR32_002793 [Streptosporangium album]|uniref:Uncharacterized protein n=1 Tax=Streptosporangium album TaxID=47479 RepID=A0A7W7W8Z6_9ACTN|nr:hypothetical protein [Streptosporangium album]MBB4938488.1 hypothetical protein [Streptosporangium album]
MSLALAPVPVEIPKNFLLSEKAARAPQSEVEKAEVWWKISDKLNKPLELNPCGRKRATTADRSVARTIVHTTSGPSYDSEQLVIYRNAKAAKTAMRKLLADARRCGAKPDGKPYSWANDGKTQWVVNRTRLANEAALMRIMMYDKLNKEWSPLLSGLVARKGSALMIYSGDSDSFGYSQKRAIKTLRHTAAKMAAKVCTLPGVC